ncbi:MAG: ATP-binding protein [Geitlerinemataceae cyanobacterium]
MSDSIQPIPPQASEVSDPKAVRSSHQLQLASQAIDCFSEAALFVDAAGQIVRANAAALKLLGYATIAGRNLWDLDATVDRTRWLQVWQNIERDRQVELESRCRVGDGGQIATRVTFNYLQVEDCGYTCAIVRQTVPQLAPRSREDAGPARYEDTADQLRAVLDAVPGFVSWMGTDGRYLGVNRHLADSLDMPASDFVGKEIGFLENANGRSAEPKSEFSDFVSSFLNSSASRADDIVRTRVAGTPHYYAIAAQKYARDCAAVVVGIDITAGKRTEEALRESQEQLWAVLDAVPGFVSWVDRHGYYLGVNRHLAASYNMPAEAFVGKELGFLKSSPEFVEFVREFLVGGEDYTSQVISARVRDSDRYYIIAAQKYDRGKATVVVGIDITERKQSEEALRTSEAELRERTAQLETALADRERTQTRLIQSEKMYALGQLVAGIAHEINNPINFIYGNLAYTSSYTRDLLALLSLYQQEYPEMTPKLERATREIDLDFIASDLPNIIASMRSGAERILRLVASLRSFSRLDEARPKRIDIHEGLDSTLTLLRHRMERHNVKLNRNYRLLPKLECYPAQINQVWMNVLTNAIDAAIDARSRPERARVRPEVWIDTETLGDRAMRITIFDNGSGIPPETIDKIFNPFFTTKPVGRGTGLGLSICYQIIQMHEGTIEVSSRPGSNTRIAVTLPIQLSSAHPEERQRRPRLDPPNSSPPSASS